MMVVINSFQIPCLCWELEREASSILLLPLTCEATNTPGKERKHFYAPVLFVLFYKKMGIHQKRYYKWTELGGTFSKLCLFFFPDELPSFLATSFCHREEWKDCWLLNVFRWPWKVLAITNKYRENKIKLTLQGKPPWDSHSTFCSASSPLRLLSLYTAEEFAKRRVLVDIRGTLKSGAKKELCLLEES